jgi:hypothetical protein
MKILMISQSQSYVFQNIKMILSKSRTIICKTVEEEADGMETVIVELMQVCMVNKKNNGNTKGPLLFTVEQIFTVDLPHRTCIK